MNARVFYIFAVPAALVFLVTLILGWFIWKPLAILAFPFAGLTVFFLWKRSGSAVLKSLDARGLGRTEGQRVLNTVESLCLASGIPEPQVAVIDSPSCNIATLSGIEDTLVVTTGLLETLDVMEMEGVVAHALTKLASGSATYGTMALSARPFITGTQCRQAEKWDWGADEAGVVAYDISGVGLTRYPPGLRSALERINNHSTEVPGTDSLGDAWFVPQASGKSQLGRRIEVLWEL